MTSLWSRQDAAVSHLTEAAMPTGRVCGGSRNGLALHPGEFAARGQDTRAVSGAAGGSSPEAPTGSHVPASARAKVCDAAGVIRADGMVIVTDDRGRENEGDLMMAAEHITADQMAFFLRHGSGIVCVPMSAERAVQLDLPPMVTDNTDRHRTAFTVTVDHHEVGTGISAIDRAQTVRALADPDVRAVDFRRPGHVFPLVAKPGGVCARAGHTEAATDLAHVTKENLGYLTAKRDRLGHLLSLPVPPVVMDGSALR